MEALETLNGGYVSGSRPIQDVQQLIWRSQKRPFVHQANLVLPGSKKRYHPTVVQGVTKIVTILH